MNVDAPYREFRANNNLDSIWFPIQSPVFEVFPPTVAWDGQTLTKKDSFHFTVLHVETACTLMLERRKLNRVEAEEKVTSFFNEFVKKYPITLVSFEDDFRFAQRDEKRTIVLRCVASNLNEFFAQLNRTLGIDMPTQPTHVTLYTLQKNVGIHIPTNQVMESLPRVSVSALDEALRHVHI